MEKMSVTQAVDIAIDRRKVCPTCDGNGGHAFTDVGIAGQPVDAWHHCRTCHGEGALAWFERDGEQIPSTLSDTIAALVEGVGK